MLLAVATAALDNADRVAQGYESHPISYSLALSIAAIGVLGTVIVSLFWWGAKGQARANDQALRAERDRSSRLERDCERRDERYDQLRRESMQDLAKYLLAGESLARLYEDLKAGRVPKPRKDP